MTYFLMLTGIILFLQSCGASKPGSFVQYTATDPGTWTAIQIRDDLSYDKAFGEVLDIVARQFEMDMISKDGGYGRTNWTYTWNLKGEYVKKYRARFIFKFSADKTRIEIKSEAEWGGEPDWKKGWDTRLLSTMKQDIMGAVGRTVL